jgi:hypothetical protein
MKNFPPYPIIALWAHPRSMSTAIERIMRERRDLDCVHEPFIYYYYIELAKKELPHFDQDPNKPVQFSEIFSDLISRAEHAPVFFKDMGYYMVPKLFNHVDLAKRLQHLILIRDPRKSILSYYKLDPGVSTEEVGVEAQWQLFEWLSQTCDRPPLIIAAETVQQDTRGIMRKVWDYLGLEMKHEAFGWDSESTPKDWKAVSGWHGEVQSSTGIRKVVEQDEATIIDQFNQAAEKAPQLHDLLEHHWPYYKKLKALAVN